MSEITIRDYDRWSDYPAMQANLQAAGMYDPAYDNEERISRFAERCPGNISVAIDVDQMVGSVYLQDSDIIPVLSRLVVRENYRRRGIASQLVAVTEAKALAHGHPKLEAWVTEVNDTGQQFWHAMGYRQQHVARFNLYKQLDRM